MRFASISICRTVLLHEQARILLVMASCLAHAACGGASAGSSEPAAPAAAAPAPPAVCSEQETLTIEPAASDADERTLTPDAFGMGPPRQTWRGDLNGDALPDLILLFAEACGNWGECPHGVFVGCGGERYATVWNPEYAVDLSVGAHRTRVGGGDWLDVLSLERTGTADEPDARTRTLRFDGSQYQPLPAAP